MSAIPYVNLVFGTTADGYGMTGINLIMPRDAICFLQTDAGCG